ncbi:thiamine-phosphate kinase [Candidatus Woesearchaeota archaeon]|nr:thiamine-phosphate kinase [Candidatus Woesearchaeota archaeon]
MKIKDLGSEFKLLDKIKSLSKKINNNFISQIGDDCAIIDKTKEAGKYELKRNCKTSKTGNGKYELITTDILVEDNHFSMKFSTSFQIGAKAIECNVSDIASCGGLPRYCVISLVLPKDTTVKFLEGLYKGMNDACRKYNIDIVGGDTTSGAIIVINIAMFGEVEKDMLCRRSDAKVGDLILVTGCLGRSCSGLNLFLQGKEKLGETKYYLEPVARLNKAREIAKYVNAMIDISDGLASETRHICIMSDCGAVIYKDKIPIDKQTIKDAKTCGKDPYDYALSGGEDYELLFTLSKNDYNKHKHLFKDCFVVGEIVEKEKGIKLAEIINGKEVKKELGKGYEHF